MAKNEPQLGPPKNLGQMERFMETCLLLLLTEEKGHGYVLMEKLGEFGFTDESINIGTLYRTLRRMEKSGLVRSDWQQSEQGPPRRVYLVTDTGRAALHEWIDIIRTRKQHIERLLQRYDEINE